MTIFLENPILSRTFAVAWKIIEVSNSCSFRKTAKYLRLEMKMWGENLIYFTNILESWLEKF